MSCFSVWRTTLLCMGAIGLLFIVIEAMSRGPVFFTIDEGLMYLQLQSFEQRGVHSLVMPEKPIPIEMDLLCDGKMQRDSLTICHNGLEYPVFPPLLPFLTIPFHRLAGEAGLRILSLLSVLALILLIPRFFLLLDLTPSARHASFVIFLASPLHFYACTFWGHAPALILIAGSILVVMKSHRTIPLALGGLLTGLAILFRPEAMVYGAALALSMLLFARFDTALHTAFANVLRERLHGAICFSSGFALGFLPSAVINMHVAGHPYGAMWLFNQGKSGHDLPARLMAKCRIADTWFLGNARWGVVALLVITAMIFLVAKIRGGRPSRTALVLAGILGVLGIVIFPVGITLFRGDWMGIVGRAIHHKNLWQTFPLLCFGLPFLLYSANARPAIRFLRGLVFVSVAALCLLSEVDAGMQWSPRYFLPVSFLLVLLLAAEMPITPSSPSMRWCLAAVFILSVSIQGLGVMAHTHVLRENKALTHSLTEATSPGDIILSQESSLGYRCPGLYSSRAFYPASTPETTGRLLEVLPAAPHVYFAVESFDAAEKLLSQNTAYSILPNATKCLGKKLVLVALQKGPGVH